MHRNKLLFCDSGANPNIKDNEGNTALALAQVDESNEIFAILMAVGDSTTVELEVAFFK